MAMIEWRDSGHLILFQKVLSAASILFMLLLIEVPHILLCREASFLMQNHLPGLFDLLSEYGENVSQLYPNLENKTKQASSSS